MPFATAPPDFQSHGWHVHAAVEHHTLAEGRHDDANLTLPLTGYGLRNTLKTALQDIVDIRIFSVKGSRYPFLSTVERSNHDMVEIQKITPDGFQDVWSDSGQLI